MKKTKKLVTMICMASAISAAAMGGVYAYGSQNKASDMITLPYTEQEEPDMEYALSVMGAKVSGTLTRMEDGRILLTNTAPDAVHPQIILNITDETRILGGADGLPINLEDVADGEYVYAYTANFMTMSLPAQTNATVLICKTPQDMQAPDYQIIKDAQMASDGKSVTITTMDDDVFVADEESTLLPYLTRNMIFLDSLQPGKPVMVWKTTEGLDEVGPGVPPARASKVVLFPEEYSVEEPQQ